MPVGSEIDLKYNWSTLGITGTKYIVANNHYETFDDELKCIESMGAFKIDANGVPDEINNSTIIDLFIGTSAYQLGANMLKNTTSLQRLVIPSTIISILSTVGDGSTFNVDTISDSPLRYVINESAYTIGVKAGTPSGQTKVNNDVSTVTSATTMESVSFNAFEVLIFGKRDDLTTITSLSTSDTNNTTLTHCFLSRSIATIGTSAFIKCRNLTTISLPGSLITSPGIGAYAFGGCVGLKLIILDGDMTNIVVSSDAFKDTSDEKTELNGTLEIYGCLVSGHMDIEADGSMDTDGDTGSPVLNNAIEAGLKGRIVNCNTHRIPPLSA